MTRTHRFAITLVTLAIVLPCTAAAQQGTREQTATGGVFHSSVKSPLGLYTGGTTLTVGADGHWASADYPVVVRVDSGSAAARAGVLPQDVLLTVNGRDARTGRAAYRLQPGEPQRWVIRVRRGEEEKELVVELPAESPRPSS